MLKSQSLSRQLILLLVVLRMFQGQAAWLTEVVLASSHSNKLKQGRIAHDGRLELYN